MPPGPAKPTRRVEAGNRRNPAHAHAAQVRRKHEPLVAVGIHDNVLGAQRFLDPILHNRARTLTMAGSHEAIMGDRNIRSARTAMILHTWVSNRKAMLMPALETLEKTSIRNALGIPTVSGDGIANFADEVRHHRRFHGVRSIFA